MKLALGLCLLALHGLPFGRGCTLICVGKDATVDGSTLISHTDDAGGGTSDIRLVHVPAMDHKKGTMRPVYSQDNGYPRLVTHHRGPHYEPLHSQEVMKPIGHIPQVRHTYGYYDHDYGLTNEVGLSMAETTVGAKTYGWSLRFPWGHSMFDISELSKIALERCATARCAIQTMGDLAVEHGFYTNYTGTPARPEGADSAETMGIADRSGEVWVFHLLTGDRNRSAVWAAQRVPDGHVAAVPNTMVIREIDFNDHNNFMWSPNVKEVALKRGWWKPEDGPFDFTMAYASVLPYPLIPLYTGRRMWRIYSIVAPSIKMDPDMGFLAIPRRLTYPFSVPPDRKLTTQTLMSILQDYYQGTEFDLTKGKAAEPFGNPQRFAGYSGWNSTEEFPGSWERSISLYRAVYSMVINTRPDFPKAASSVLWFGEDAPHGTVWVPFYGGQTNIPPSYLKGKQSEFSLESAYWAFNFVNNWSYQMWRLIHAEVVKEQERLQKKAFDLLKDFDHSVRHGVSQRLLRHIEQRSTEFAEYVVAEWWNFAFKLIGKYNNGYICTGERVGQQKSWGYPIPYLREVGYTQWPAKTFYPVQPLSAASNASQEVAKFVERPGSVPERTPEPQAGLSLLRQVCLVALGWTGTMLAMRWAGGRKDYEELP